MATTKKTTRKKEYTCQGKLVSIQALSRCAIKVGECYYTVEATETRSLEGCENVEVDKEWLSLFASVNDIIDKQAEEINELNNPQPATKKKK
jgi:hypothetical protein